jgi:transposase InsO family protein
MTLIDEFTGMPGHLGGALETMTKVMMVRGVPENIRSNNGPEMMLKAVREWLAKVGAQTLYIEPGSPWENGYCESFNISITRYKRSSRLPAFRTNFHAVTDDQHAQQAKRGG